MKQRTSWGVALPLLAFFSGVLGNAQSIDPLRSAVGVSFTGLSYLDAGEYQGPGIDYTFFPRDWLGLQGQVVLFPTTQILRDALSGGRSTELMGSVLVGPRIKRVHVFAQVGIGDFRINVLEGVQASGGIIAPRNDLAVVLGGIADIQIDRRWSVRFEGSDMRIMAGNYTQYVDSQPFAVSPSEKDCFQFSTALVFHFK